MLDTLRKSVSGWVAKIFIGLLVLSFAVWGVADIFGGYGRQTLATVGETEITNEEFRYAFQQEMQNTGRQFGRTLSLDQARALGIDSRVLGRLLTNATLDNAAQDMKVAVSDDIIANAIVDNPNFKNAAGEFQRDFFEQALRSNGMTEQMFVFEQKRAHRRQQVADSVAGATPAPDVLIEAMHKFQAEERTLAYVVLSEEALGPLQAPDETALRNHYTDNKDAFRAPEYRKLVVIPLQPAELARDIEVPEEDIRALYESREGQFGEPEQRQVQQILFSSRQEAEAAAQKLAEGADFMEIARDRGLSESDISLGLVSRSGIVDEGIREAAFSLQEGGVSDPVDGALGTAIVRVSDIQPATEKPLEEVKDELRQELAVQRAGDRILDLYDQIEDERAAGLTFPEIGRKLNIPVRTIEAVDARGNKPSGETIAEVPAQPQLLQLAFSTEPGVEVDPVETRENGYVWLNVADITPSRERSFEEVRGKVEESWREETLRTRLGERASDLLQKLRDGASLDSVAQELGVKVKTAGPLKRNGQQEDLSRAAIQSAFSTPVNGYANSLAENGTDRILMQVRESNVPPLAADDGGRDRLENALSESMANTLLGEFITAKQDDYGVTLNQQNLNTLLGQSGS